MRRRSTGSPVIRRRRLSQIVGVLGTPTDQVLRYNISGNVGKAWRLKGSSTISTQFVEDAASGFVHRQRSGTSRFQTIVPSYRHGVLHGVKMQRGSPPAVANYLAVPDMSGTFEPAAVTETPYPSGPRLHARDAT